MRLQLLLDVGLQLASERQLDVIADVALNAGCRISGAELAAFVYARVTDSGEVVFMRRIAGSSPDTMARLERFPVRPVEDFLADGLSESRVIHLPDLTRKPEFSPLTSFAGIPVAELSLSSYMALPVRGRNGERLGAMLYGHHEPDAFTGDDEKHLFTLAAQAAAAIENARLAEGLAREISLADAMRAQQHQAECELAETARRLRQALDAGELGTWSWNKDNDLLDLDERAAEILGADRDVPVTRTALRERIVFQDDLASTPEDLNDTLQHSSVYHSEYRVDTPDGQRWVSSKGLATLSEDGQSVVGMTGTVQDITSQKTQEATLRQTEKLAATGRMAATIAHEINNPLEAVTNLIYLSKTDPSVPGEVQHLLELADTELARVSQIAQQTLGFYRDTSHPVDIDLSGLLSGVADLFSRKLQSRNLRIDLDVHDNLHIFGLQGEVRQVFSNLLVNAIDASTRGTIRVRARSRHAHGVDGVAVMICDEGAGIAKHIRPKLFAPFFTTKHSIGTGLGLWVTRGIVEKGGGHVRFRSRTDPPTGTVFRVFLPSDKQKNAFSAMSKTALIQ